MMKHLVWPMLLLATGCSSLETSSLLQNNLLDVAPKNAHDVIHPEWGYGPARVSSEVQGNTRTRSTVTEYGVLENFLLQNNVSYEVMPGNHLVIKLTDSIKFKTGSSSVSAQSAQWLYTMSQFLRSQSNIDVIIDGHTDSTGNAGFNDRLSEKRAKAVEQQLLRNNVNKQSVFTRGYGEYNPTCSNATASGKACNRRAELLLIVSSE